MGRVVGSFGQFVVFQLKVIVAESRRAATASKLILQIERSFWVHLVLDHTAQTFEDVSPKSASVIGCLARIVSSSLRAGPNVATILAFR